MNDVVDAQRQYVKAAMRAPFLEREEERALAVRWRDQRDQDALHRLTSAHMRLVIAMAGRFRNYGLPAADLIQEGNVGLLEAASRFEPDRDVRFSTYATWWIRASMQDYILRNWSIVRGGTSSNQKALFFNLRRLRAKLSRQGQERMSHDVYGEIATALGVPVADVAAMDARLSGPDTSLNAAVGDADESGAERMDFLKDTAPLPDEVVGDTIDSERRRKWLRSALRVLNERELRILKERRLRDSESVTLETLGGRLGISKERVRQIENRALEKVRRELLTRYPHLAASYA